MLTAKIILYENETAIKNQPYKKPSEMPFINKTASQ
jgi:hypothetical protein